MITDPVLLDEIAAVLDTASPEEELALAVDECGLGLWDDDLLEIAQYAYVPGALKLHAVTNGAGPEGGVAP